MSNKLIQEDDFVMELLCRSDLDNYWHAHIIGERDSNFTHQLQAWANGHYPGGWNQFCYYISELILAHQNTHYYKQIIQLCGLTSDMRFLDAGCGAGQLLKTAHEMGCLHLFGVDADPIAIDIARRLGLYHHYHPQLFKASIEGIDFPANFFDVIVCRSVVMYCDASKAISELNRCLKKGGMLYLTIHRDKYYFLNVLNCLRRLKPLEALMHFVVMLNARLMRLSPAFQVRTSRTKGYHEHSIPLGWLRKRLKDECLDIQWIGTRNLITWEVLALKV